ncbi:hypothetical protein LB504_000391 [Fusarium proliferatum]|nr:hypothetical protein LB504_000391 [Fusarium proliferatum]
MPLRRGKEETTAIGHCLQRDLQSMLHRSATHSLINALHLASCTQALIEGLNVSSGKALRMKRLQT